MNSREIILKTLYNIEEKGGYFNKELSDALTLCSEKDHSFVTEIIYGVTKNKLCLDHIISCFSSVKLKKMTPWVKNILRMGIYQMYYMDKIPHSAACNESVKLSKKYSHNAAGRFINGVLRNISRNIENIELPDKENQVEYLSVKYSFPQWLTQKLLLQYGFEVCENFMSESNKSHHVNLRVNPLLSSSDKVLEMLKSEGVDCEISEFSPNCITVFGKIDINKLSSYKEGYFSLQNISSYKAVRILEPQNGELIMDICAAPGGKSCAAAEMMNNEGQIISFDIHSHKTQLIEKSANRLKINIIKAEVHDGRIEISDYKNKADRVILDAPCSGIGVIHKKPDIKWARQESDIAELTRIQKELLETSCKYVKDKGTLLYSTCTVLKDENQDVVDNFLARHPDFSKDFEEQILTGNMGESGFYICRMKRNS